MAKNNIELLAPAGGMAELKAAVQSGADAVYIGASSFSARAGAGNFSPDEMRSAVEYAHAYGVKVHCALNTLIKESEIDSAIETAVCANECGVDALIIQDIGISQHIKKLLPNMELHGSTQMTVTSLEGVKALEKMGFSRVVLARELSLSEIEHIVRHSKAEIEVFVHGAICMCYSGQCLMSSMLGGRSGNRGKCAQPCRLPYELIEKDRVCENGYLLSPKDMALIKHLEDLRRVGVSSLKIEGRLKSAQYVSAVVGVYRKYLDNPMPVSDTDMAELKNAFSRSGFTDGYLTGNLGKQMMSHKNPANNSGSTFTAEAKLRAEGKFVRKIPIDIYASLFEGDVFRVTAYGKDGLCVVSEGSETAQTPQIRPLDGARIEEQLRKLGDTPFEAETVTVEVDKNVTVPIKEINKVRRAVCDLLWKELCRTDKRQVNNVEILRKEKHDVPDVYLTAEVMTRDQGNAVIKAGGIKRIYAPCDVAEELSQLDSDIEIVTRASDILSCEDIKTEAVSVSSLGAMVRYGEKAKYGEWRLNVYNSLTAKALSGLSCITVSPELNLRDIADAVSYLPDIDAEIIGYGRIPLMIMKNCPIKALGRCQNGKNIYKLRDRKGIEFPIVCTKECKAVLLNSKPIYTADMIDEIRKTKINCIRLNFTVEKSEECGKIVNIFRKALEGEIPPSMVENTFTRGHLKRGV